LNEKALMLIEATLKPWIEVRKRDISKMVMNVNTTSSLVEQGYVRTKYGDLVIVPNYRLRKGSSYIIEETSKGSAFGWVNRKEK